MHWYRRFSCFAMLLSLGCGQGTFASEVAAVNPIALMKGGSPVCYEYQAFLDTLRSEPQPSPGISQHLSLDDYRYHLVTRGRFPEILGYANRGGKLKLAGEGFFGRWLLPGSPSASEASLKRATYLETMLNTVSHNVQTLHGKNGLIDEEEARDKSFLELYRRVNQRREHLVIGYEKFAEKDMSSVFAVVDDEKNEVDINRTRQLFSPIYDMKRWEEVFDRVNIKLAKAGLAFSQERKASRRVSASKELKIYGFGSVLYRFGSDIFYDVVKEGPHINGNVELRISLYKVEADTSSLSCLYSGTVSDGSN